MWISAEASLPETVADEHHAVVSLDLVLGGEDAAELRLHAQDGEEIGGGAGAVDFLGLMTGERELSRAFRHRGETVEHVLSLAVVDHVRGGESGTLE